MVLRGSTKSMVCTAIAFNLALHIVVAAVVPERKKAAGLLIVRGPTPSAANGIEKNGV